MKKSLQNYDPSAALSSPEAIAVFMVDALETGDDAYIAKALHIVAQAKSAAKSIQERGSINGHS